MFLKKIKIELPYDSSIQFWDIPKGNKITIWNSICTPVFTAVLFTVAKIRKQPKCSSTGKRLKNGVW